MYKSDQPLVTRNLIEGLLLGIPEPQRSVAAEVCHACGYDPAHPRAFYGSTTLICMTTALGQLLFPTCSYAEAAFALGTAVSRGYVRTLPGQLIAARLPRSSVEEGIRYSLSMISRELAFVSCRLEEVEAQRYSIRIKDHPLHPEFMRAVLIYTAEKLGCEHPVCSYLQADEHNVIYDLCC